MFGIFDTVGGAVCGYSYVTTSRRCFEVYENMKHSRQLQKELAAQEEKYLSLLAQKSELEYRLSAQISARLANLLDNSIEASRREPSGELLLHIFRERGYDAISIKNKKGQLLLFPCVHPTINDVYPYPLHLSDAGGIL